MALASFLLFSPSLFSPSLVLAQKDTAKPAARKPAGSSWTDAGIGSPAAPGTSGWDGKTMTLTGVGAGLNVKGVDQCQYRYLTRAAGDFEMVVCLTGFTGEKDAAAGLMARADNSPSGAMAALTFSPGKNTLGWVSRLPGATPPAMPRMISSGIVLAQKLPAPAATALPDQPLAAAADAADAPATTPAAPAPLAGAPLWLRMVRAGKNFAVYKSRDGQIWTMISNVSGGAIAIDGPVELGVYVASGISTNPVTASFQSLSIKAPAMRYKTSWVGNNFGCREEDGHVANGLGAMWVAPDGTVYANSWWDEAGTPGTSYKDGKVVRVLPGGGPSSEGSITGDGKYLYLAAGNRVTQVDRTTPDFAYKYIDFSVNLTDKTGSTALDGLVANAHELFAADSRDNLIRIVSLDPVPTYHMAEAANDRIETAPKPVVVPDADAATPPFAPALVYQTRRCGEGIRYTIPGMTPGAEYTFRCHLAAYTDKERADTIGKDTITIQEAAGGALKAFVKDFPGYKADAQGNVVIHYGGYGGSMCGLELLDAKGVRQIAINCGGPTVGDFKGESPEQVSRAIPFDRPGPMVMDKRGDLWITQRGNDFPVGITTTAKYPAAIKCYKTDGTFTGREITDVVNPRALGYDAAKDQLLVGENGPDLNVRFYSGLDTKPALAKTFGQKGGIYAGAKPGLVADPAAGGLARFAGISGVGVDAKGNLYVGGGIQGTDLRQFDPAGKPGWMLNSLMFCNTYDVDPASDGTEIYGTYNHVHLDLAKTAPGTEQKFIGSNWDVRKYGAPDRQGGSQSIVRRVGATKQLMMYTSGQGLVGDIKIFRYDGEIAIPAGAIRANDIWTDANGDGKEDPSEVAKMATPIGWVTTVSVDSKGGIWAGVPAMGGSFMRHFSFKGLTTKGVPLYSAEKGTGYEDTPFPEEGGKTSGWAMACRMDYDADRDIMIAFYPSVRRTGEADKTPPQYSMGRYDNWSKGNRVPKWKIKVPTPYTDPNYYMYEVNFYPYSGYMGMQLAGDYVFMAYLFGEIHAFDLKTGKLVESFAMGPEVAGGSAWEDAAMGLRAFKTKAGEYLIFTENSGWGGKDNFIRWHPAAQ